jgi:hypothetical protein
MSIAKDDGLVGNLRREEILALLSDEETARVSNAEAEFRLTDGDEYLDLEHLDRGMQRATGTIGSLGRVIPRKSVHRDTWTKIMAHRQSGKG